MTAVGCQLCGRTGVRGFTFHADTVITNPDGSTFQIPGWAECAGKVACRRRQYRRIPAETRAAQRIIREQNA